MINRLEVAEHLNGSAATVTGRDSEETTVTTEASAEHLRLPRPQAGAQPQHILVTLLGDYWLGRTEPLPSAALVALAEEFGISESSARAALSRLARRRLVVVSKSGRHTFYEVPPQAERMLREGRDRIFSFGHGFPGTWDGTWLVVVFSVPEEQREARYPLRSRLRWLGFGPLDDGVWVSPRQIPDEVAAALEEFGVGQATLLRSLPVEPSGARLRHPLSAWNLAEVRLAYEQFIETFGPLLQRVRKGQVSVSEALVERTAIMDAWRTFPDLDPDLPDELLPADWPRRRAYEIFAEAYDTLGPLAQFRFRQIIAPYAPDTAQLVSYQTTRSGPADADGQAPAAAAPAI
jgi:phenylacetic acid degradation operon negative regulatory protein